MHDPADLAMAEDLASRAAIALDNARLYHEVQEADRQKNEFLSMLAHELRNPLAPIRNAVEVLQLRGEAARRELGWARDVIDRQVTPARPAGGRPARRVADHPRQDPAAAGGRSTWPRSSPQAVEASRPLSRRSRHELDVTLPPEPVRVDGDPARLAQVLTNLLNNAAKYTRGRRARSGWPPRREGDEAVVRGARHRRRHPAGDAAAVFDLFTQADRSLDRSQGGLGIGLTLVQRLVEMHGGTVEAHSDGPGTGSEFVVRLPVAEAAAAAGRGRRRTAAGPAGRRCRVLVVDDNVDAADALASLLERDGHEVRRAHDGPAALAAAAAFRPDVVVLDIGLPGMDGYEVARRLRRQARPGKPLLVAVTGYGRRRTAASPGRPGSTTTSSSRPSWPPSGPPSP